MVQKESLIGGSKNNWVVETPNQPPPPTILTLINQSIHDVRLFVVSVNAGYVSHKVDDRHTRNAYAII